VAALFIGQTSQSVRMIEQNAKVRPRKSLESGEKSAFQQSLPKNRTMLQDAYDPDASQRACWR
jgi:hypothetical protein